MRSARSHSRSGAILVAALALTSTVLAACGSSGKQAKTPASAKQTIVFATQGLGAEGDATKAAVTAFEHTHPNIKVDILTLSPTSNSAYQQLTQRFIAGSSTPDVLTLDVIWPATFARSGWLMPLDQFRPQTSRFFKGQVAAGQYQGKTYAMPWFINAEGVYYRTDLVPKPPATPDALVTAANQAKQKDNKITTPFAFEGDKYEGVVTAFVNFLGGFGGKLDPTHLDTAANRKALQFMHDSIYGTKIAPEAVTGWQESNVQDAFLSGQAAFAMNWPYIFSLAEKPGSSVKGKTGWIPFPSASGAPAAALGGSDLAINAKSGHAAAAWELIQYLTSPDVQIARAVSAGDPPSVTAAYNGKLYAQAPFYKQERQVFDVATPRPVNPDYPKISDELQTEISAVLANQKSPAAALKDAQRNIQSILG